MRRRATLTSKGQITIPVAVRRRLGLRQGDVVEFDVDDSSAVLRPAHRRGDPFTPYAGALGTLDGDAAVRAWLRDLREDD